MSENLSPIKLQLRPGDTPVRVLSVLEKVKGPPLFCELSPNFVLITELDFLKKLKETLGEDIETLTFITQKEFFASLLKKRGFKVLDTFPEDLKDQETKQVKHYLDRVEAQKNTPPPTPEAPVAEEPADKNLKSRAQFTKRKIENLAREKSWRGLVFFLFIALIGLLLGLFFFISPRAEIVVKPRIDTIETTQNMIVSLADSQVPLSETNLPKISAILVETELANTDTFASTRKEYEVTNARGKITLYNRDSSPKFLVPSRLSTDEGLIFRTQANHTIPAAVDDLPGSLEVEVIADPFDAQERPVGDRGNIANDTALFFPALREPLQELYYAKADRGPLVGGSTLTRYFIEESDLDTSQKLLEESLRVRGIEQLREEIKERSKREDTQYVLLDQPQLVRTQMQDFSFPIESIGEEQATFEASARYKIGAIVFDQAEVIEDLAKKLRLSQDQRKKIVEIDESSIDYRLLETNYLSEDGWLKISVSIVGVETIDFEADNAFAENWREIIKREVAGREMGQARGVLVNHPEVEEVLFIKIMPFWNKVIPTILDQIDLKIRY